MKIAIAQMNPVIGAIKANTETALALCERAQALGAQLVVFPELYLSGYPPKDLLLREDFLASVQKNALFFAEQSPLPALMGAPWREHSGLLFNTCLWLHDGKITIAAHKRLLPTYNIFDERRYFSVPQAQACDSIEFLNKRFLVSICEDAWNTLPLTPVSYDFDPVALGFLENGPIDFFINISASPYSADKPALREKIFSHIASSYGVPVLVAGQVGGNDQLLFDGQSLIIDAQGITVARAHACQEDLILFDSKQASFPPCPPALDPLLLTRDALVMGMRDYVQKCGAPGLVIGLSGGIDSAVCAALAVRALGPDRVRVFFLGSKYSSLESHNDAQKVADNLGLTLENIPIEPAVQVIRNDLASFFKNARPTNQDLGDQNIQSRIRGLILMGICNASDYFMVATSNKSELAAGYGTIYGDMCGAFSPLGDLYKTEVWRLAHALNAEGMVIPESLINKAPSAELKPNQKDSDSLPDYALLDKVLYNYIDLDLSPDNIYNNTKIDINIINEIINMVNNSEYKRRQAPFPLMVSNRVFGEARRLPIAKRLEL